MLGIIRHFVPHRGLGSSGGPKEFISVEIRLYLGIGQAGISSRFDVVGPFVFAVRIYPHGWQSL